MMARCVLFAAVWLLLPIASAAEPAKADPLSSVRTRADLDALIEATKDPAIKKALGNFKSEILAAAARKPHVDAVIATLDKAKGSHTTVNETPEALAKAIGGPSTLFDCLKSVSLASSELGVKAKRDPDPFGQDFYEHLGNIDHLEDLVVMHTEAQNAWLKPLAKLTALKSLRIVNQSKLDDEGLMHLAGLKQLEVFSYIGTKMTGAPFRDFRGWTNLKRSSYRGSRMSDAGLTALCENFPTLETLVLAHGMYTDEAVAKVASLKNLKGLEIGSPKATPQCLKHLVGLPLEYLQLGDGLDASAGIAIIREIKTLKRLTLTNCVKTTDEDLKTVAGMKHLEHLELNNLDITPERLPLLKDYSHLKSIRITRPRQPYTEELKGSIKSVLPEVAIKFE